MKVRATILAGCLAALAFAAAPASSLAAPVPCSPSQILTWLPHGFGSGTAGSIYYQLWFTNLSKSACTVSGFPTVTAVGLDGRSIGSPAGREPGRKGRQVRLAAGASATARLRIVDTGAITPSVCRPAGAAGLRVKVPPGGASQVVPLPFEACARGSALSVGPFHLQQPGN
jgi:hypothetical protein